ncbi:SGNH/GDSL hydrolase family protein [Usitatibacter palustris]|uniref:SGNH hydrolase-type esterase domain-containing protein n=1 Tax=Usitatibacter palustris TaxID=2732487 RepID=A0A6M4H796_9PROT|nr:SGNH/GDSL hydrolase family protein [Usitatibacter palustris]QJR15252.1 hypothetical protein DSM104440_02069 [Usitatibacter palustris]
MNHSQRGRRAVIAFAWAFASAFAFAQDGSHWVASWGTAQMVPEGANVLAPELWRDSSLRQIVRVSLGGQRVRVRLSNAFGTTPLIVEAASLAKSEGPGKAGIDEKTAQALTFNGRAAVMIPAGAEYYSDPLAFEHAAGTDFAISMYFKGEPVRQTGHPGSRTNSFITRGNRIKESGWSEVVKVTRWYNIADIEVMAPRSVGVVVAIGDSITDGHGATTDGNDRWTDALVARLAREKAPAMGVVNAGIGGGRMLRDGLGPSVTARFDRDVISRSGVTHVIIHIGVNDLGGQHRNAEDLPEARAKLLDDLKTAYRQVADRARAQKVCVIGATITPYVGSDYYRPNADNEADRQALNAWIRNSGTFDAVADFDAAIRDPAQPERMHKDYDKGDGLHQSPAGFRAMAEAIPLAALRPGCK